MVSHSPIWRNLIERSEELRVEDPFRLVLFSTAEAPGFVAMGLSRVSMQFGEFQF